MTNEQALQMTRDLLAKHDLSNLEVTLSKTKRALGRCFFLNKKPVRIDLSSHWLAYLSEDEIRDTILHEIAHAKAGVEAGHGYKWKATAQAIGANPKRTADLPPQLLEKFQQDKANYVAVCQACENKHYFHRFTKNWKNNRYRCGICQGEFNVYSNR